MNHADLETGVLEKDVLGHQWQGGRQEVSLTETKFQKLQRDGGGGGVELSVGELAASVELDDRDLVWGLVGPFGDCPVEEMPIGEFRLVIFQRVKANRRIGHDRCLVP